MRTRPALSVVIVRYVLLTAAAVVMMLPYLWMVSASFQPPTELSLTRFVLIPRQFTLQNFVDAVHLVKVPRLLYNSLVVSAAAVILQTAVCAMAAYALARFRFPGATFLLLLFIATMMVPEEAIMVPLFLLLKQLNLLNSYLGMILPVVPWGFSVYMLTEFFREIPREIEESAIMDGCSPTGIFLRIILPLARPALGAVLIFSLIMTWDQFVIPLLVVSDASLATLPLGLANMIHEAGENHTLLAASTTLGTIPVLIFFLIFQRSFIRGLTAGAVKG